MKQLCRCGAPVAAVVLGAVLTFSTVSISNVSAQERQQAGSNELTAAEAKAGWISLFDGKTLSGWEPTGSPQWKVENGTLVATSTIALLRSGMPAPGGGGFLKSARAFSNYELRLEFFADATINSGVFVRCTPGSNPSGSKCYEVNIYDPHETFPTGSIGDVHSTLPDFRADSAGKWNTYEITADGSHLVVKLNGKTTTDAQDTKLAGGYIALQAAGSGTVRFRNIKIRSLGETRSSVK